MRALLDSELWASAQAGDPEAFGVLYERHALAVQAFCLRRTADPQLAEDLTATVFLESWRQRRQTLTTPTARPFLLGIATNLLRQHWRARRRHAAALQRVRSATSAAPARHEDDTAARIDAERRLLAARDALGTLPRHELEVLTLVAWGELSYEETAAALGIPIGTVRSRLSRARARFIEPPLAPLADFLPAQGSTP